MFSYSFGLMEDDDTLHEKNALFDRPILLQPNTFENIERAWFKDIIP